MTKSLFVLLLAGAGAANADIWHSGDLTTYTQDNWGGNPSLDGGAALLQAKYDTVYAGAFGVVTVGSTSGFTMTFSDAVSVLRYLPAIGPFAPFNSSSFNPIQTAAGGLGGEVLGLEFNVDFSDAGFLPGASGILFGDLILQNFGAHPALNGLTVRQFLGDTNTLLGGGSTIFSIADLGSTVGDVNASFSAGNPSVFAQDHLVAPVSAVPEPSSLRLVIAVALGLGVPYRLRRVMRRRRAS
jgi:hypothetical protein